MPHPFLFCLTYRNVFFQSFLWTVRPWIFYYDSPTQSINFIKTTVIVRLSASANIPKTWKTCSFVKLHTPRRFLQRANLVQTGQNTGRSKRRKTAAYTSRRFLRKANLAQTEQNTGRNKRRKIAAYTSRRFLRKANLVQTEQNTGRNKRRKTAALKN